MNRQKPLPIATPVSRLWLAAQHGQRLTRDGHLIAPTDEPEEILDVEFEGLTEDEQRAALEGFPGGRRFRLAASRH